MRTHYRLGIDAGGTFTDFVLADKSGNIRIYKTLSTPNDPTKAIQDGLQLISDDLEISSEDIISQSDLCINGTTVGLNALIQHKGSPVGLICTEGHEDSIEIRLGHKEDGYRYDPDYPPAVMLSPRYLRKGIRERILSNGKIKIPINEDDVREACKIFINEGIDTIAISFVWSVLNQSHEIIAEKIVREMMPNAFITVGSKLYPQIREYTRTSTAITVATAGKAVFFSGITVAIGLMGMLFFENTGLPSLGIGGTLAVSIAMVFSVIVLPAILALMGNKVFKGKIPFSFSTENEKEDGAWAKIANFVMERPWAVLIPTLVILLGAGLPFLQADFSIASRDALPPDDETRIGFELIDEKWPEGAVNRAMIVIDFDGEDPLEENNLIAMYSWMKNHLDDDRVINASGYALPSENMNESEFQHSSLIHYRDHFLLNCHFLYTPIPTHYFYKLYHL